MRYIVEERKLDKDHVCWPNQTLFYIIDVFTGQRSLGCYTNLETAQERARMKNNAT